MDVARGEGQGVRPAAMADADVLTDILASAFANDPVMTWTLGDARAIRALFYELTCGLYLKKGFAHIEPQGAATLWLPSGATQSMPVMNKLRIAISVLSKNGFAAMRRALAVGDVLENNHPKEPHYYLFAVGVKPQMQGRGLGGRLIREGLKRVDTDGAPAYLENSNPKNTPLYERLGFKAIAPLPLPDGAPPLLAMLRPANISAGATI